MLTYVVDPTGDLQDLRDLQTGESVGEANWRNSIALILRISDWIDETFRQL